MCAFAWMKYIIIFFWLLHNMCISTFCKKKRKWKKSKLENYVMYGINYSIICTLFVVSFLFVMNQNKLVHLLVIIKDKVIFDRRELEIVNNDDIQERKW